MGLPPKGKSYGYGYGNGNGKSKGNPCRLEGGVPLYWRA
jgi:hypothetical protein